MQTWNNIIKSFEMAKCEIIWLEAIWDQISVISVAFQHIQRDGSRILQLLLFLYHTNIVAVMFPEHLIIEIKST